MKRTIDVKTIALLLAPLLLFAILVIPYSWLNRSVIVDWLGCGCPQTNELGEIVHPTFNANDFTALFWLFISICITVASAFLSMKKIPKEKWWIRVVYVIGMFVVSIFITYHLCQIMMWN